VKTDLVHRIRYCRPHRETSYKQLSGEITEALVIECSKEMELYKRQDFSLNLNDRFRPKSFIQEDKYINKKGFYIKKCSFKIHIDS